MRGNISVSLKDICLAGFVAGLGFMAAQELWWMLSGLVGLCHG